jgi:hypothetical protein
MMIVKMIDDRHGGDHRIMMIVKVLVRQDDCPAVAVAARQRRTVQPPRLGPTRAKAIIGIRMAGTIGLQVSPPRR